MKNTRLKTIWLYSSVGIGIIILTIVVLGTLNGWGTKSQPANVNQLLVAFKKESATDKTGGNYTVKDSIHTTVPFPIYIHEPAIDKYLKTTTTNDGVVYMHDKGFTPSEKTALIEHIKTILTHEGLTSNYIITDETTSIQTIIVNSSEISCQITEHAIASDTKTIDTIELVCIDTSSTKTAVKTIQAMLSARNAPILVPYKIYSLETDSQGKYGAAVLNATTFDMTSHYFVYVSTDSKWQYIGNASSGVAVSANLTYIINGDVQKALDDKGYGPVLHSLLFKSSSASNLPTTISSPNSVKIHAERTNAGN